MNNQAYLESSQETHWIDDEGRLKWLMYRVKELEALLAKATTYQMPGRTFEQGFNAGIDAAIEHVNNSDDKLMREFHVERLQRLKKV